MMENLGTAQVSTHKEDASTSEFGKSHSEVDAFFLSYDFIITHTLSIFFRKFVLDLKSYVYMYEQMTLHAKPIHTYIHYTITPSDKNEL